MGMFFDGPVGVSEDMQLAAVPSALSASFSAARRDPCLMCASQS